MGFMDQEFETKVLNIDVAAIIKKLRELGAKESPEKLYRRYVFDIESENAEWIRLRDNGEKVTLTYKNKTLNTNEIGRTTEIETEVADFEKTARILKKIPFKRIFYQENKTHIFYLNSIEFSIDTWPKLEPHLEIESESKEKVKEGLRLLGLEGRDSGDVDVVEIYQQKGFDLHSFEQLKF